uniref:RING-type domain-containing protein n=1 Tax=Capitella teleta TaxID=283909 RepID=X2B2P1_CAPTE
MLQEKEEMKEQSICKVCMANDSNAIFLPCGHFVCCNICACALTHCPICRTPIKGTICVYRS